MDRGAWWATVQEVAGSGMIERLTLFTFFHWHLLISHLVVADNTM